MALRAGDERAFDRVSEGYLPVLYRFALRRVGGERELARDLVQTTMCKVIEKLDSYRGEAPLFTWLCACCRHEIAAHFRRLGRRPREVELAEGASDGAIAGARLGSEEADPEERLVAIAKRKMALGIYGNHNAGRRPGFVGFSVRGASWVMLGHGVVRCAAGP